LSLDRHLIFLVSQLVDSLLEYLVDLGKDILRYLLEFLDLPLFTLHLLVQHFDRLSGYLVVGVVEVELLLVLVLVLDEVRVALDELAFLLKLFSVHFAVLTLQLLLYGR